MTKKTANIGITVSAIFLVICMSITMAITILGKDQNIKYNLPETQLSTSIFEQQNSMYYSSKDLPYVMTLKKNDYKIDVFDVQSASKDNLTFFFLDETVVMAIGEGNETELVDKVLDGNGRVFVTNHDDYTLTKELMDTNNGYLNGHEVEYNVIKLDYYENYVEPTTDTTGKMINTNECLYSTYTMLYKVKFENSKDALVIALTTDSPSDEMFEVLKETLDTEYYTLRPSKTLITDYQEYDEDDEENSGSDGVKIENDKVDNIVPKTYDEQQYDELAPDEDTEDNTDDEDGN